VVYTFEKCNKNIVILQKNYRKKRGNKNNIFRRIELSITHKT
jgi:hypothetical protein